MFLESVHKTIDMLEAINPNDEFAYEKAIIAYSKLREFPVFIIEDAPGFPVFRTRTHIEDGTFNSIDEISLPPKGAIKNFARCNKPGQQIFYCSENRPVSYLELLDYWVSTKNAYDKLHVTIGRWVTKKNLSSIIITTPNKTDRKSDYDKHYGVIFDEILSKQDSKILDANILFYSYLTSKFRLAAKDDLKTYIITSTYSNLAFIHARGKAESICYPSVPSLEIGVNWAISPTFFNSENIELTHVMKSEFEVLPIESNKYNFQETATIEAQSISLVDKMILW